MQEIPHGPSPPTLFIEKGSARGGYQQQTIVFNVITSVKDNQLVGNRLTCIETSLRIDRPIGGSE